MIKNSFVFLKKISRGMEQKFWKQGLKDWPDFLQAKKVIGLSLERKNDLDKELRLAQQALLENDSFFFVGKLPSKEMWRLYDYFKEEAGYLDVEINGRGEVILVGISNYYQTNSFVGGFNLEQKTLEKELKKYKLLITFNGSAFDLPKLKKQFKLDIPVPHLDLKPLCLNLGLKGGLKEIEKQLNLKRPPHLYGNPVELWKAFHASGDKEYLNLLLDYNKEDIENLKAVADKVCKDNSLKLNEV
ncbi:ribonuclease H-like domain-containing protein [Candidatus Woesearchaeota archaeon]|nr:ribonuclease H-like domain-containing protein [Candidatus Woesearchaeota archaeon]